MLLRKINVFKLQFCKFEKFVSMSVFGELQLIQISLQLENQRSGNKIVCGFSILILNGIMMFYSQRVHAFCWTKIKTLIKMERNQKWKIPHTVLERQTLFFSAYKNRKFKVKLWWVGACERKKEGIFCNVYFAQRIFFLTFVFCLNL